MPHQAGVHADQFEALQSSMRADLSQSASNRLNTVDCPHGKQSVSGLLLDGGIWIRPAARPAHPMIRQYQYMPVSGKSFDRPDDKVDQRFPITHVDLTQVRHLMRADPIEVVVRGHIKAFGAGPVAFT